MEDKNLVEHCCDLDKVFGYKYYLPDNKINTLQISSNVLHIKDTQNEYLLIPVYSTAYPWIQRSKLKEENYRETYRRWKYIEMEQLLKNPKSLVCFTERFNFAKYNHNISKYFYQITSLIIYIFCDASKEACGTNYTSKLFFVKDELFTLKFTQQKAQEPLEVEVY